MIPGERILEADTIELNVGRETLTLRVDNLGDKPIQVGSHTHFFEVNKELSFDRARTYGFRLDVPAGTALRFEPGEGKEVTLVAFGGARRVYGMNGLVIGDLAAEREAALGRAKDAGFAQELAALDPAGCVYTDEAGVDDALNYACGQARICRFRWHSKDYEYLPESSESLIYLAMIRLMLTRLAKSKV